MIPKVTLTVVDRGIDPTYVPPPPPPPPIITPTGAAPSDIPGTPTLAVAWSPGSLPNLAAWYEGDDAANDTTGGVYVQYTDKSGRANHLTAAASGNRPVAVNSTLLRLLKKVPSFQKVNTHWLRKVGASLGAAAGPISIWLFYRQVTWTSGGIIVAYGAGNRPQFRQPGVHDQAGFLASGAPESLTTGYDLVTDPLSDSSTGGFADDLFRVTGATWDGTTQKIYREHLETGVINLEDSDANAGAATADGGTLAIGASVAGVLPCDCEIAAMVIQTGVTSAQDILNLQAYWKTKWIGLPAVPVDSNALELIPLGDSITEGKPPVNVASYRRHLWDNLKALSANVFFCGTRTTRRYDQPVGYASGHEGESGDTVTDAQTRVVGFWSGNNVLLGQTGDPGPGNRGALEILAARADGQGSGNRNGGVVLVIHLGTNDASSGPINEALYTRFVQRCFNVHGRVKRAYLCKIIKRTDGHQANNDTFNADLPGIAASLNAAGYTCSVVDLATGFNTGTMLIDQLHPNHTGGQFMADQIRNAMQADGLV